MAEPIEQIEQIEQTEQIEQLEEKIHRIELDMVDLIGSATDEAVHTFVYGAYDIDPGYLSIQIILETEAEKTRLLKNRTLYKQVLSMFAKHDYPYHDMPVGFSSQEVINKKSFGNPFHHFR